MNQLDELLNCSICLDRYKDPKILPCHHSFCAKCINRLETNSLVTCPNCRSVHDASQGFENDFRTNQLLDFNNYEELSQIRENIRLVQPSAPIANEFNEDPLNQNHRPENGKKEKKKIYRKIFIIIIIALIAIIFFIVFIPYLKKSTIYFCNGSQFWDGSKCVDKSHYKEYCKASFECNDMKSLLCINNSCTCYPKYSYFDFDLSKCKTKLHERSHCSGSYQCLSPMLCRNQLCQCESNQYFNEPALQCLNKTSYNSKCESSSTCQHGLLCIKNKCQCNSSIEFWSNQNQKCLNYYEYGQLGCLTNEECNGFLMCNLNPNENNCSCPLPSKYGMCDCRKNENEQFYWNGATCAPSHNLFSKCKFDYECKKPNICLDRISLCSPEFIFSSILRNGASFSKINFFISVFGLIFCRL